MKMIQTTEPIVARSFSFFWFKRVYTGARFESLPYRTKVAILLHEFAHCNSHHTEWRVLLWPLALWLPKRQELWADAFVASQGYAQELHDFLIGEHDGGLFHPSNWQRRQNLMDNKFFASPPLRVDPEHR
jgi:hypothetical protein